MGCRVCRARKVTTHTFKIHTRTNPTALRPSLSPQVKCDGRPNGCRNCERLQLECVADDGTAAAAAAIKRSASTSTVALKKIRTYRSCNACRLSKTKCDGDRPKCGRCVAKKVDCVYDGGAAPRWTRNLDRPGLSSSSSSFVHGDAAAAAADGLLASVEKERSSFLAGERRLPPRQDDTPANSDAGGDGSQSGQEGKPSVSIPDGQSWYVTSFVCSSAAAKTNWLQARIA